ncbi:MAG: glycosyltransferase [Nitrospirae bacterium]|nr:MAG: glycosyltransferase [Nitrospirota bacterium]
MRPILVLARSLGRHGGAERDTLKCIQAWCEQSREVHVAAAFCDKETIKLIQDWGVRWTHFANIKRPVPIAQTMLARKLRALHSAWKNSHPHGVAVCFDLLPNVGDIVVGPPPAHLWWNAQRSVGRNPWRRPWMRLWEGFVEKKILEGTQKIVVFSEQAKRDYELLGIDPSRVQRVLLSVDLSYFHPPHPLPTKDEVLIIGNSPSFKGVDLALLAWRHVAPQLPDLRLRIVCKPQSRAARLARMEPQVTTSAPVDDPRVYYHRARLVLTPSMYESWCNVVAEALACGLPVITSQNVAASELVQAPWLGKVMRRTPHLQADARMLAKIMLAFLQDEEMLSPSMQQRRWEHMQSVQKKVQNLLTWARSL